MFYHMFAMCIHSSRKILSQRQTRLTKHIDYPVMSYFSLVKRPQAVGSRLMSTVCLHLLRTKTIVYVFYVLRHEF